MAKNSLQALANRTAKRHYWKKTVDLATVPKTRIKTCLVCQQSKPCRFNSSFTASGEPEYKALCVDCQKVRDKQYHKKYRSKTSIRAKIRRRKLKQKCIDYLGGKCISCGYDKTNRALTFHHRDPSQKEYEISRIQDWSWSVLKQELDKCDLLCFNCHMEAHEDENI